MVSSWVVGRYREIRTIHIKDVQLCSIYEWKGNWGETWVLPKEIFGVAFDDLKFLSATSSRNWLPKKLIDRWAFCCHRGKYMCLEQKDLFSSLFLSWWNSPLTVSASAWPRVSAAVVSIKARRGERGPEVLRCHRHNPVSLPCENHPTPSLDKPRREFKSITYTHTPQIPKSLLVFLYRSPEPLRTGGRRG